MPKKLFKRYIPNPETLKKHRYLGIFARFLTDPYLFHMNRHSVSRAFAVGLFWAFIPFPSQMLAVVVTALIVRFNLPIAAALVWITNPITTPPMFYLNYTVGTWLLGKPEGINEFEFTLKWAIQKLDTIWIPFLTGSLIMGILCGLSGYIIIRTYWRWHVIKRYKKKQIK